MEDQQAPTPFGTRLTDALLKRIYRLTVVNDQPISLDSNHAKDIYPPILQASSQLRDHLLPVFLSETTFSLRRASLCAYQRRKTPTATAPRRPLIPTIPPRHRAHIRKLRLETFNGARECLNASLGRQHRNSHDLRRMEALDQKYPARDQQSGRDCCDFCRPFVFPNLLAMFPRLRSVRINISANRDSDLCWASFCREVVRKREPVWMTWTRVGQGNLQATGGLVLDIRIVDEKLSRVWKSLKDLRSAEVQTFVEVGIETAGVRKALRISESMALKLMRLLYSYDCTSLHCGGYLGSSVEATGSSISWDLRARDEESWGKEVLTAWNWTLRQWLKRGVVNGRDYWYVRAMEGGGVRDVIGAGRLEATLLDEFERLAV